MSFYGDLASLGLADVLQNAEANGRTGTLSLKGERGSDHLFLEQGRVAMYATADRPPVLEILVANGAITADQLKKASKSRRGTRRSLGETLVKQKVVTDEELREAVSAALAEDVCDLLATAEGEFKFNQGPPPPRLFDPEERRLKVALAASPLILEAARRLDHWEMVRKFIPSDSACFVAKSGVTQPDDGEDPDLMEDLCELLDGSRNVTEVTAQFPQRDRLVVYEVLAGMVRDRMVRAAAGDELATLAHSLIETDADRAREIVSRGLEAEPHHEALLNISVQLAEAMEDPAAGASAHKVLAHLRLESGNGEEARRNLEAARRLTPNDTSIRERLLSQGVEEGRKEDAIREGLELADLYREPGLTAKALEVLEGLVPLDRQSVPLRRKLAQCQVDAGDPAAATTGLQACARELIARERYSEAREVSQDILNYDPSNEEAAKSIDHIDQAVFASRRARRRKLVRLTSLCLVLLVMGAFVAYDTVARIAQSNAMSRISRERLIEDGHYKSAMEHLSAVKEQYPFTPTAWFEIPQRLEDLRRKDQVVAKPSEDSGD